MNRVDQDLVRILRTSELSRDLKLQIVDIVSAVRDDAYVSGFIEMLKAWDEADNKTEINLLSKLEGAKDSYSEKQHQLDADLEKDFEELEDVVEEGEEIENLKKSIQFTKYNKNDLITTI